MVGALRQPDLAGRQRHRAAAGRAAAGERGVPGIARAAKHFVEGAAAGAEFRRVGLRHHDAALALDALDDRMGFGGHMIGEQRRAVGRAHARDVGEVLDRHRQTGKPTRLAFGLAGLADHDAAGMGTGAIEAERGQSVHCRLDLGDAPGRGLDKVERRDFALLQQHHRLDGRQFPEIVVHRPLMAGSAPLQWRSYIVFTQRCATGVARSQQRLIHRYDGAGRKAACRAASGSGG